MKIKSVWFNTYLALGAALLLCGGCETKNKKDVTIIELHQEVKSDGFSDNMSVPVYRQNPIYVNVDKSPFLDSADLDDAAIVDSLGGFEIQLKFNWRGTEVLRSVTTSNRGGRVGVFCVFGKTRWLASPQIQFPIKDGILTFTPDATREEAERIVKGIKEMTIQMKKDPF